MNFCKECDNYLTLQMKETAQQDKLIYVCKNYEKWQKINVYFYH